VKIIAITGGIGSGKSTFLKMLESLNQTTLSADELSKQVTSIYGSVDEIYEELLEEFGKEIFSFGKHLDRHKLASIVFNDAKKKKALEDIVLPQVHKEFEKRKEEFEKQGVETLFCEVPALFEMGLEKKFDQIILVTAPEDTRIKRVLERQGNTTKEEIKSRINAQLPEEEKIAKADLVFNNISSLDVMKLWIKDNLGIEEKEFNLTFKFSSKKSRDAFATWICNCGEQDYWNYCQPEGEPWDSHGQAVNFDYWSNRGEYNHLQCLGSSPFVTSLDDEEVFIPTKPTDLL